MSRPERYNKRRMALLIFVAIIGTLLLIEIVLLLLLRSQVDRYATYWQRRAVLTSQDNELTYVALGNSTAQGVGATSPARGYVGLIAEALTDKTGRPVRVVNLSKSGARLVDCLRDQVPRLVDYSVDVITIEIGANDMADFKETVFRRDMEQLIAKLPKHAIISDMPYFGGGRRRHLEPNVQAANKIIQELASVHGLDMAPLHRITQERDSLLTLSADLLHPSNRGYRNWFDAFWSVLQKR